MTDTNTKERETRAQFIDEPENRIGGDTTKVIRSALKKRQEPNGAGAGANYNDDDSPAVVSSPLLTSTPPTISKALVKLYPNLIVADRFLTLVTWTGDDIWQSVLMVILYVTLLLYFEKIAKYFGHLAVVAVIWAYSLLDRHVEETLSSRPTLDDIVHTMNSVITKADMLLSPITILSAQDIRKLLFTTAFLSPIYIIITLFILPPRKFLLIGGIYLLTYNSPWSVITRRLLWRFKLIRLLIFYVTGLDSGGINKNQGIFAAVQKQVKKLSTGNDGSSVDDGKPIRFTYVLYENQRRWLGIGWTSSMLSYERASWTDEFLNEAPSPDNFKLPEESSGMLWKWVDKTWRLDMTNDGAIQLSSSRPKTTASPNSDDGFIYYDNTWKKPSTDDSFSKYTRRRRWIRTAELIKTSSFGLNELNSSSSLNSEEHLKGSENHQNKQKRRSTSSSSSSTLSESEIDKGTTTGSTLRRVSFSEVDNVHIIPSDEDKDIHADVEAPAAKGPGNTVTEIQDLEETREDRIKGTQSEEKKLI